MKEEWRGKPKRDIISSLDFCSNRVSLRRVAGKLPVGKDLEVLVNSHLNMSQGVPWWPRRPTVFWLGSVPQQ